ncbi:hypothetical protein CCACVL1_18037, partial [Corchorus capsularis]
VGLSAAIKLDIKGKKKRFLGRVILFRRVQFK